MKSKRLRDKESDVTVDSVSCRDYAIDEESFLSEFPEELRQRLRSLFLVGCKLFGLTDANHRIDMASLQNRRLGRSVYPDPDQPDFMSTLMNKEEYDENRTSYKGKTIRDLCPAEGQPFSLLPYQQFLVNFMSPLTPYKGLLIFHGVGAGKTSTALSIAENFKDTLSLNTTAPQRRVLILALNKSIDLTFRNTLYNPLVEEIERRNHMRPGALHTTADAYFPDVNLASKTGDANDRREAAKKKYETFYEISDPTSFTKKVYTILTSVKKNVDKPHWATALRKALCREYANRLIIVDEVHGIKENNTEKGSLSNFKPYDALKSVVTNSSNVRLLLMTATPMFNEASEAISILNLLLLNDGAQEINKDDIFNESQGNVLSQEGLSVLRDSARPYISYIRGYNPVSFPEQLEVNHESVKKVYAKLNAVYMPRPKYDVNAKELPAESYIHHVNLIQCPMSKYQFENYLLHNQVRGSRTNVAYKYQIDLCNMIYPMGEVAPLNVAEVRATAGSAGREGFDNCFRLVRVSKSTKDKIYKYTRHCVGFLDYKRLRQYSCKYWLILQNILRSPGICFVYCENIEIGVETIAMCLDANGYERESGGNYLQDHGVSQGDKVCGVCNKPRKDTVHGEANTSRKHKFMQAHYVILQHQDIYTVNSDIVSRLKRPSNIRGHEIKVILGSKVTKESFDFSNVRQIHVASAWYNMSKIVQIIGRGVRNCSHMALPDEERNVVVFRYCVSPPRQAERTPRIPKYLYQTETADEFLWRMSQMKDVTIKRIERELKTVAVDCIANREANVLPGDVDGSRQCDYSTCDYACNTKSAVRTKDSRTADLLLSKNELDNTKFMISRLFGLRVAFTFDDITKHIKESNSKIKLKAIALALTQMLGSRETTPELVVGPNGLTGYIIQADKYYVFQPLWAKDKRLPVDERTSFPAASFTGTRLSGDAGEDTHEDFIEAEMLLRDIEREPDLIMKFARLDYRLSDAQRIDVLEHLIQYNPQSPLLRYFRNFLLFGDTGDVTGHFLSSVPHCLTVTGWFSCNLEDKKKVDRILGTLYQEPEADFVGYMQDSNGRSTFKIVNNTSQRDKTRLDLKTALNTLTKGKTCGTYDRVVLNYIARELQVDTSKDENKSLLCTKLEYAFRKAQSENRGGKRRFYNLIETEQRKQLAKRKT